ncbi:hypothetical protein LTR17_002020 [Elasticomyces elasticus]|nr:hypothetical protein LTR17_002020 [Elasticomyces elasticus]
MRDEGRTRFEIAREIQRSLSTVSNILKVMGKTSKAAGSTPWLPEDDKKLIRAREASVSYKDIAKQILPGRSLTALIQDGDTTLVLGVTGALLPVHGSAVL